ncbi:hypothetical protein [Haloarcula sp. H-GB5]
MPKTREADHYGVPVVGLVNVEGRVDSIPAMVARARAGGWSVGAVSGTSVYQVSRMVIHPPAQTVVHHLLLCLYEESEHRVEEVVAVCNNYTVWANIGINIFATISITGRRKCRPQPAFDRLEGA